ncbi:EsaB/YukD family protein [Chordicoccus furentiruminis]|uniref:EsaB/YukD family protein n=1 Tax=Chordicoccus furentiruminis TaxID=2709410 RepID=UPI0023A7985B|nr:EsaB/YukD family protein [Chordicoccus furentiruminis]
MRDFVIVTVADTDSNFDYDMELPVDVPFASLKKDILEVVRAYDPKRVKIGPPLELYCMRLKRTMADQETPAEAGIWSGDFLVMNGRKTG